MHLSKYALHLGIKKLVVLLNEGFKGRVKVGAHVPKALSTLTLARDEPESDQRISRKLCRGKTGQGK